MLNKIKGAMFGIAIGDAMGATTEFMKPEEIAKELGRVTTIMGGGWLDLRKGEVTDDTQMSLAVAKGILENPKNPILDIGTYFLEWRDSQPKDIGSTVATSMMYFDIYRNWQEAAKEAHSFLGNKSAGNGSLMRCLPVALAYPDSMRVKMFTKHQSLMTHYDDEATEACLINNSIAISLLSGGDLKDSIKENIKHNKTYSEVLKSDPSCVPDGYVVNTFKWVLRTLYTSTSFSEVIETLVNLGEDSDTSAAIAGGLAGLYWGYDAIPKEHIDSLLIKKQLEDISNKLYELRKSL